MYHDTHNPQKITRCAVYTRKSTEHGLEQAFNSLDYQRLAGEDYIRLQREKGWELVKTHYDDGGYSGGNIERPALKALLKDIEAGLIDCVVVYKMDRFSRSLLNFFNLIQVFEKHGVSLISVTESFNTSDAVGRLLLGTVMGFAQYEREQAGERVRHKVAASRRKGLWMGGGCALGYDGKDGQLVINPDEAVIVRYAFERYACVRSQQQVCDELNAKGYRTKGKGNRFTRNALTNILTNPVYCGKVRHKDQVFEGQHTGIISQALWERVQKIFKQCPRERLCTGSPVLLKGLLRCQPCGVPMTATHAVKKERTKYRYYVCSNRLRGKPCSGGRGYLPTLQIEAIVIQEVRQLLRLPEITATATRLLNEAGLNPDSIAALLQDMDSLWSQLFPAEQRAVIETLIQGVNAYPDHLEIRINSVELQSLAALVTANGEESTPTPQAHSRATEQRSAHKPSGQTANTANPTLGECHP